jgi:hypothetical protein
MAAAETDPMKMGVITLIERNRAKILPTTWNTSIEAEPNLNVREAVTVSPITPFLELIERVGLIPTSGYPWIVAIGVVVIETAPLIFSPGLRREDTQISTVACREGKRTSLSMLTLVLGFYVAKHVEI